MSDRPAGPVIEITGDTTSPDDFVPVLNEGAPPLDLPPGATLLPDGSVKLDLEFPRELTYRQVGSGTVVRGEHYDHLVLRRLSGRDVRRLLDSKNAIDLAIAISSGMTHARFNQLQNVMDSADVGAAQQVVNELLGDLSRDGLPVQAEETDEGIRLPLFYPATDGDGELRAEILFSRMTGADRKAIATAPDTLTWAMHRATGLTPKAAKELIDGMDGADVVAANRVIGFLAGNGRRTGR